MSPRPHAWPDAAMDTVQTPSGHTIRPFRIVNDYKECVALQEATWGRGFSERVAPAILKVSQILGGVSAGAYDADGALVGFVFGMTGVRNGELVHWSDMLAVRPEARGIGLGRALKAYQREQVLALGVRTMHWTFDPLQARNAHLNFARLGIVVREYAENMYGETDSPLHRGIGTDRFIALWPLDSDRVRQRLSSRAPADNDVEPSVVLAALDAEEDGVHPRPGRVELELEAEVVSVPIPSALAGVMDDDMDLAIEWREATRIVFTAYLGRGYEVFEIVRGPRTSRYLMRARDRLAEASVSGAPQPRNVGPTA